MTKIQRYFSGGTSQEKKDDTGPPKTKHHRQMQLDQDGTITYNIKDVKLKPWGRRASDKLHDKKKGGISKKTPDPSQTYTRKVKGRPKVPPHLLIKHSRGEGVDKKGIRTTTRQQKILRKEKYIKFATEQAAKTEVLLTEASGYLEADAGETTTQFTQQQIRDSVDISAATKSFELRLDQFGPYRCKYSKNGRHLALGGKRGHVASFDWATKRLHFELNAMESVHDVCWLHIETMLAVAQKDWVYIYDNQGIELHCVKRLNKVTRMEFLPYHFLLAACSETGYLSWLDVSIGNLVTQYNTKLGKLHLLAQNPWNGVLHLGHSKGVVSMWSPNTREPLAKMLCHKAPLTALHIDPVGLHMATCASNRELKIWDIRSMKGPLQDYKLITAASNVAFGQKNQTLALAMGNIVEVYKDCITTSQKRPYLRHRFVTPVQNMSFCPYEDVLGVATSKTFTSLLIPGSGEPNFDALEANPFQSKSQRREAEVKSLLEKVQPELIALDPTVIADVNVTSLRDKVEAKAKLNHIKPQKINYEPRNKAKGKGGSVKLAKNKKIVQEQAKKEFVKSTKALKEEMGLSLSNNSKKGNSSSDLKKKSTGGVLDRFLPTVKK